jgi:RNA polymerase sigma-54 factor
MQKLGLIQTLSQKLSPQQIQFIKLLQIPTLELATRIEEELETNPALEEGALISPMNRQNKQRNLKEKRNQQ